MVTISPSHAIESGEVATPDDVVIVVADQFHQQPVSTESAYYKGALNRGAALEGCDYSVVDGHGQMMSTDDVETLRPALEATLGGTLLGTSEALAEAEQRHAARLALMNRLFRGVVMNRPGRRGDLGFEPWSRSPSLNRDT